MSKSRIKELEKIIAKLDTLFEKGDDCINPITGLVVLDNEYDALKKELFDLHPKSKIFTTVTSSIVKSSKDKVIHDPPMTSINKCNGTEDEKVKILSKWLEDAKKIIPQKEIPKNPVDFLKRFFSMSYKHDGLAISLEYENGKLIRAGLRSKSGKDGINVTDKTKYIENIPQKLSIPVTCIIRGEVETHVSVFKDVSEKLGDKAKANPRAHTAGSMNQKTAEQMKDRGLTFIAYNILNLDKPPYKTEIERAAWVKKELGINFVKTMPFTTAMLKMFEKGHRRLDFMVDGVVLSINDLKLQKKLGTTGSKDTGNPKGKLAWKFKDEIKEATIKDIVWQTGRTGNITPVLIFDGIQLEGTTVSKCTAHNWGRVKSNKIGIGSKVEIIKSGKIIPKLHKVVKAKGQVMKPENCPSCEDELVEEFGNNETLGLVCENTLCPAQNIKNLNHFLKIIEVKGIAGSTINKLVEAGMVQKRSDFYKLTMGYLLNNGFTERTSTLILSRIWMIPSPEQEKDNTVLRDKLGKIQTIKVPMEKFFAAFGIDGAGKEVGRLLSKKYKDFDKILGLSETELSSIDGIGPTIAKNTYDFLKANETEIHNLRQYIELEAPKGKSGKLNGKSFVLSGALVGGKSLWKEQIEEKGGEVKSSVGRKVHYVVAGEGSGSKSDKAKQLNIPIITVDDLEEILDNC